MENEKKKDEKSAVKDVTSFARSCFYTLYNEW